MPVGGVGVANILFSHPTGNRRLETKKQILFIPCSILAHPSMFFGCGMVRAHRRFCDLFVPVYLKSFGDFFFFDAVIIVTCCESSQVSLTVF
jgi:hypothetical protein